MFAHVDGDVGMDHLHRNLLPGLQEADPGRVTGVEIGLARLYAPGALEEGLLVHHHLITGKVCEVDVIHLVGRGQTSH